MPRIRLTLMLSLLLLACGLLAHFARAQQAPTRAVVYVVPIEGVIDLGLAPFVSRVLDEAKQAGAAAVVLDIDTFGGRVDAAVQIRDALLESTLRTVAFVNKRAISAGALIALSTQTIAMAPGGTIGAAAPVQVGAPGAGAMPAQEKTVSYVRKEFGATAEARKRPQLLAAWGWRGRRRGCRLPVRCRRFAGRDTSLWSSVTRGRVPWSDHRPPGRPR
jgi:membrane-bound serine protease (ClpP class)